MDDTHQFVESLFLLHLFFVPRRKTPDDGDNETEKMKMEIVSVMKKNEVKYSSNWIGT